MKEEVHNAIEVTCRRDENEHKRYLIKIDPYVKDENGKESHDELVTFELNQSSFYALQDYFTKLYIVRLKMLAAAYNDVQIDLRDYPSSERSDNPWLKKFEEYMNYLNTNMFESGLPEYPDFSKGYLEYVPRNKELFDRLQASWKRLINLSKE